MTQDNQPQVIDVVAMQQTIQGLQNQRNAAFNDAADLFGKLQSAHDQLNKAWDTINSLRAQLAGNTNTPTAQVIDGTASVVDDVNHPDQQELV